MAQVKKARSVQQQAERYGVCNSFIRKLMYSRQLPYFRRGEGGKQMIYDEDIDRIMNPPAEYHEQVG